MRIKGGRFLVIGGAGFIGSHVVDVSDCAQANICAMLSEVSDEFYDVGAGKKTSLVSLVSALEKLHPNKLGHRFDVNSRPFVRNRVGSMNKAKLELGFSAQIDLQEGLEFYFQVLISKNN